MPEIYFHFQGLATVKHPYDYWGGCSLVDYGGHLWKVASAINGMTRVDVYAYRVSDKLDAELREEFATWTEKKATDDAT